MHPAVALVIGTVPFYLAYMIPLVGFLVYWLVLPWGVGAALIRMFEVMSRERRPAAGLPAPPATGVGGYAAASSLISGAPGPATHALSTPSPAGEVAGDPVAGSHRHRLRRRLLLLRLLLQRRRPRRFIRSERWSFRRRRGSRSCRGSGRR
jgi:hypothetical protein